MKKGIWDSYGEQLLRWRQAGVTLEEIGRRCGVSRERVRQVFTQHDGRLPSGISFTVGELAQLVGLACETVRIYRRLGIIRSINTSKHRLIFDSRALMAIRRLRCCQVCGEPVRSRYFYCSDECAAKGYHRAMCKAGWRRLYKRMGQRIPPSVACHRHQRAARGRC